MASNEQNADSNREHPTFTVDTHLFRELGELLVGRDSTALVELVKNSYDADATEVTVYGERLTSASHGYISIRDNGTGMGRKEFEDGFLRIASRTKEVGERRSEQFGRRYTGAKGIGRLAAHKLAHVLEVVSFRAANPQRSTLAGVEAKIQWDVVEKFSTLEKLTGSEAVTVHGLSPGAGATSGTTITLRRLRSSWSKAAQARFLEEIQTFGPSKALVEALPRNIVPRRLLFDRAVVRDSSAAKGAVFDVRLEGDLAPPEGFFQAKVEAASWVLEIDATEGTGAVRYAIAPTKETAQDLPDADREEHSIDHPAPKDGPFFQARIFIRTGRAWETRTSGVRVFMEGFRILPYGESRNDWLGIDRDVTERGRGKLLSSSAEDLNTLLSEGDAAKDAALLILPNKHYFGAVFLTQHGGRSLRMLVNREGFVPDSTFETLTTLVRGGIDLATRVGDTPLLSVAGLARRGRLTLKAEYANPFGSVKDRTAAYLLAWAIERFGVHVHVVESTSGNLGVALARVGSALGLRTTLVMDESLPEARIRDARDAGAEVALVRDPRPGLTFRDTRIALAAEIGSREGHVWLNQYANPAGMRAHEEGTGPEIWDGAEAPVDAVVASVGTGGTICGISASRAGRAPLIVGVEPRGSTIFGGCDGDYLPAGSGMRGVPGIITECHTLIDLCAQVSDDVERGIPIDPKVGLVTFHDAAEDMLNDYKANRKRTYVDAKRRIKKHLAPFFGNRRLSSITASDIRAYIAKRMKDTYLARPERRVRDRNGTLQDLPELRRPVSAGEINRELTVLKRMFSLAIEAGKLHHKPHFAMLREDNVRVGFFEREQYEAVLAHLPEGMRPVVTFAYVTGWRINSEVLPLQWRQVDLKVGEVRLDPGTTKNREGRVFYLTSELHQLLKDQRAAADEIQRQKKMIVRHVFFHRDTTKAGAFGHWAGKGISEHGFYHAWRTARTAAGCPGSIPHDFRRTAIRNMVRAGIPERVAMKLSGHKTRSVFDRYNVVSDGDLRDAARRLGHTGGHTSPSLAFGGGEKTQNP